ncbi:MAG: MBL fold metallo-hydrolase [Woeseiaceae bacterium]
MKALVLLAILTLVPAPTIAQDACIDEGVVLQILGSGGPRGLGRASAGYLVWVDGVGRVLVDAGGGMFVRFHEAGARVEDLEVLALSHFHADHSSDVAGLLWLKPQGFVFSGPTGSDLYPSAEEYVSGMFGPDGVFRAVTNGKGLNTVMIDVTKPEPTEVFHNDSIRVRALGVPHGIVPAVGYRVEVGDVSIAFSSDQNGSDPAFAEFASGVDALVIHMAVPESVTGFPGDLHAKPSVWGQVATDANVGTLVVSHLSAVAPGATESDSPALAEKLEFLRSNYKGPMLLAEDLMCIPLD